jgi:hypothetical protein
MSDEGEKLRARMEAKRQGLVLSGRVVEAMDRSSPVAGATAVLELFPTVRTTTDAAGEFRFDVHRDYNHKLLRLHFEKPGYRLERLDLTFDDGMAPILVPLAREQVRSSFLRRLFKRD